MSETTSPQPGTRDSGPPEAPFLRADTSRARFLREVDEARPRLHRYCTRMLGSALDGEDVVQETLAATFFRLEDVDPSRPLLPLLFRIAHNRCIDWLRRRRFEDGREPPEEEAPADLERETILGQEAVAALENLVLHLPPRERSCFLLRELLEHPANEVAEIVGCSTGAVKSALHRARARLAELRQRGRALEKRPRPLEREAVEVLERYVQLFNARDWRSLAELLAEDVRLDVVGVLEDGTAEVILDRYTVNYSRLDGEWRLTLGRVDGELVVLCLRRRPGEEVESVAWPVRVQVADGRIEAVRDYVIQSAVLDRADVEALEVNVSASR